MLNKRTVIEILLIGFLLLSSGCSIFSPKGRIAAKEVNARSKVENVESMIQSNVKEKLDQVGNISYGIQYALDKEKEPSQNVKVAKDLSARALSLTGSPTVEEINKMRKMIDDLTSQLKDEKDRGEKALADKDDEIYQIQLQSKALKEAKDEEIRKYMKIAQDTAARADAIQSELDKMDRFFGLGAVFYGLKRFVLRMAWILGIGSLLYLILRLASASNPIAASIFAIFDQAMSWFVHIIKLLAPKAVEIAGHTATAITDSYKKAMFKVVDCIEALKAQQQNDPNKKFTLNELLTEISKSLNDDEKKMIDKIKRDIGY